jgi:tetratricopeptide (TPR) repeat protein
MRKPCVLRPPRPRPAPRCAKRFNHGKQPHVSDDATGARQTAENEDKLIGALGSLSRTVREKAGESLRTIRASTELERVSTSSLAALRKYVEGSALADEAGEAERGLALLDEAVALDTGFAMAWRKIAVLLGNEDREPERALAAIATAFRHRSRLTEMERLLTEGYYYTRGPQPSRDRALAAYEEAIRLDSTSTSALNNAAVVYGEKRDYERAEALYRRVVALPRTFGGAFTNLITEQIRNGRISALDSTVAAYRARFPQSNDLWEAEWYAAWGQGNLARADSIGRAVYGKARTVRQAIRGAGGTSALAYLHGRLQEGRHWQNLRSEALLRVNPSGANRLQFALDTAYYAALVGDTAAGRAVIARGLGRYPTDSMPVRERPWQDLAQLAALLGDVPLARRALAGFERDEAASSRDAIGRRAYYSAHVAMSEARWAEAIGMLQEADARIAVTPRHAMAQIGRAFDMGGQRDSAIVYYEKFVTTREAMPIEDPFWRPRIHRRLGALYEDRGSTKQAIEQYARFVELWAAADSGLQPQVAETRAKLGRLRAAAG